MFGRRFELFRVFGFPINIDPSWLLIMGLLTWSLAGFFPTLYPDLSQGIYWGMGLAGALGLFASVLLHELSHAVTAQRFGLRIRGITLFLFGGVAEMTDEPPHPKAELVVAIAGPIASVAISGFFFVVGLLGGGAWPVPVAGVIGYLAFINVTLAVFNMIPAFPLDGGRVLRAALWQWKGSLRWATRITSTLGSGFGIVLMVVGAVRILRGGWEGIWWLVVGMFVRNAAQMSYQQLLLRQALEGEPVARFMQTDPVTVPRALSVAEMVRDYVYRYHHKMFPVVDDSGRLLGCVTTRQVKELPHEEWDRTTVGALALQCGPDNTVAPDMDAMRALSRMSRIGASRLMVVDGDRLLGILTLKDLLRFFSLKMELDDLG